MLGLVENAFMRCSCCKTCAFAGPHKQGGTIMAPARKRTTRKAAKKRAPARKAVRKTAKKRTVKKAVRKTAKKTVR